MQLHSAFADALAHLPDYLGQHVLVSFTAMALGLVLASAGHGGQQDQVPQCQTSREHPCLASEREPPTVLTWRRLGDERQHRTDQSGDDDNRPEGRREIA